MNIFAQTITVGGTIYNKSTARITGDKVGAENYATWKSAMAVAHSKFYDYAKAVDDSAKGRTVDVKQAKTEGMDALQEILNIIGEINGHTIVKDEELFGEFIKYAVKEKTELMGRAMTIKSQLDNAKAYLKTLNFNGVNPETLENAAQEVVRLEEELKLAKKEANSGKPYDDKASFNAFCTNFERKLAKIASDQYMKSWEELEAEEEARRAERRAKAKARRQAKRQAQAIANAQATNA